MRVHKRTSTERCNDCKTNTTFWVDLAPHLPGIEECYSLPCGCYLGSHAGHLPRPPLSTEQVALALLLAEDA